MTTTVENGETGKISQSNKQAFRNPWVLGWLGLLTVVIGVNIAFITTAIVTNPGLVSNDYYQQGRDHEQHYLQRVADRKALGWNAKLDLPKHVPFGADQDIQLTVSDRSGDPLRGAEVVLNAYRPSDAKADFSVPLQEVAPGQYKTATRFPLKGVWDLIVVVKRDDKGIDLPHRISVKG